MNSRPPSPDSAPHGDRPVSRVEVESILTELGKGKGDGAEHLLPVLYQELRDLAEHMFRRERMDHTLQPTALVHEAYMRMLGQTRVDWKGRTHFMAIGAQAMRRILIDHARKKGRLKRGEGKVPLSIDEGAVTPADPRTVDAIDLADCLERLQMVNPRMAQMVEMRFFGGLGIDEVAEVLQVSRRTVEADWTLAKAWLNREFSDATDGAPGGA